MKNFREKLFSIIRCGLQLNSMDLQITEAELNELIEFGDRQCILPIIYSGLKKMTIPEHFVRTIDNARNKDIYQYIQRNECLKNLSSVLDQNEIAYIFLKGSVLRDLYPSPEMRTSRDIDILVREADLQKAVEAIENGTDFKINKRSYHDISLMNDFVHLELHFSIKENSEDIDKLLSRAWEYAIPTDNGSRYVFTPEFQMFHVISHMKHHFIHGGLGVRPFLDLWLLRNKTDYDEDIVRNMCSECGILKFYEECCTLSEVWLEQKAYTETSKLFEDFCLSGELFGSAQFKNAGRQSKKRGIRYILSRVFPPAYQVREYYKDENGKQHSMPYLYMKRLLSWFSKSRRAELNRQLTELVNSDQDYLDQVDKLFSKLGL